jgi:uncharacterized protein
MSTSSTFINKYGPWAVVTGASDGIGLAFAEALARRGLNLVIVARRQAALDALAVRLSNEYRIATKVIAANLSTDTGVASVLASTEALPAGLLVASAGFGSSGAFIEQAVSDELDMIDVNCKAVVSLSHAFGARFVRQHRGGMILLSSLVAFQGVARTATYAATKAFVQTFAEGLERELSTSGVHVLACAPGPVSSGFAKRARMTMGATARPEQVVEESLSALGVKSTVIPGMLAKVLQFGLSMLPRSGRVRVMSQVMRGMT